MPLGSVCVHIATPITQSQSEEGWAAGEPTITRTEGKPFPCLLQLPAPGRRQDTRGREVREPTLLWPVENEWGEAVEPVRESAILAILAPELTGAAPLEWQVAGTPLALGPPGNVIGYEAALIRVSDGAEALEPLPGEEVERE